MSQVALWLVAPGVARRGGVLFLALKMSQDPVDDVLVLNACDDPDRTTAESATANLSIVYAFEPLRPGHCSMTLSR